jgi:ribose transport system ATP-binding protein
MAGEVHALLGENGSGKSTLIKILSGYHVPDGGSVHVDGEALEFGSPVSSYQLGFRFIHQDLGLIETMSVRDNLMLGAGFPLRLGTIRDRLADREARQALDRAGLVVEPKQLVAELSPAQRTGVAVARALRRDQAVDTKVLVLDEPTASLPEAEVNHLFEIVRTVASRGVAVIYVTHRLEEVPLVADKLTVLRGGSKVATETARGIERRHLIHLLVGSEIEEAAPGSSSNVPVGEALLTVDGLRASALDGVSFEVHAGDVVGVAGILGSGRETLLGAIFGALPREEGTVRGKGGRIIPDRPPAAVRAGIGYVPADRKNSGGFLKLSARENLTLPHLAPLWKTPVLRRGRERAECERWFDLLSVRPSGRINEPLERFSGGNQQKVLLAKWLRCEPDVLLLDEPTQGVDIASRVDIHRHLIVTASHGTAVVLASSDVAELAAVCSRVIVLRGGRIVADLRGEQVKADRISREAHGSDEAGRTA